MLTRLKENLPNIVPEINQSEDSTSDNTVMHELTESKPATEVEVEHFL